LLRRDNIGITRLSVFFSQRSFLILTRRFLAALVRGRPFIGLSSGKPITRGFFPVGILETLFLRNDGGIGTVSC
jgi:hypothetical protein